MQIQRLRKRHRLTQAQLAKRIGISQQHVAKLEKSRLDPKLSTLERVAAAFGCDVRDLFLSREEFLKAVHRTIERNALDLEALIAERDMTRLTVLCSREEFIDTHHPFWGDLEPAPHNKLRFKNDTKGNAP